MGERLLDINVFAQLHGTHGCQGVQVVRRGDVNGIDAPAFLLQHLTPVLIDAGGGKLFL